MSLVAPFIAPPNAPAPTTPIVPKKPPPAAAKAPPVAATAAPVPAPTPKDVKYSQKPSQLFQLATKFEIPPIIAPIRI